MDTFEKLEYKIRAGIEDAKKEKEYRLSDRYKLPLKGLDGEKIFITGVERLNRKAQELKALYKSVPENYRVTSAILIDAYSSATIEGAYTTVDRMKKCLQAPETKDEIMVANTYKGCMYAYENQINEANIRHLWNTIVEGVCENADHAGKLYREGMVFVGNNTKKTHTPAKADTIQGFMYELFKFYEMCDLDPLIKVFVFHFYFVYVHPFCDGNGRTARIINNSQLYFSGFPKVKSIAFSTAINRELPNYYKSITECEKVIDAKKRDKWLDLSPFIEYMQGIFEDSMTNAVLSNIELSDSERKILGRMNKVGINAEITVKNAMKITKLSYSGARNVLFSLANNGYLQIDKEQKPYLFKLMPHV